MLIERINDESYDSETVYKSLDKLKLLAKNFDEVAIIYQDVAILIGTNLVTDMKDFTE
jgi:hypothetical protein